MAKLPLTPEQKLQKQKLDALQKTSNVILMNFSFKKILVWGDVYRYTAVPATDAQPHNKAVIIAELKAYLKQLETNLRATFAAPTPALPPPQHEIKTLADLQPQPATVTLSADVKPAVIETVTDEDLSSTNDYGLKPSPNEKAFFYWFQKKAIVELFDAIVRDGKKCKLLLSGTGTGKTYMCGGLIRRLVDAKFHDGKTFGVTEYLYVTRASIVEQTKRVFQNTFGLGISNGVEVLNIEQLRSRAGAMWVNEKSRIVNGEEEFYWEWKKMVNPVVIIWDECQALKNSTSSQHKIAAALNDLPDVVQVHVSATPFTRVCEAKCFAVATHKSIEEVMGIPGAVLSNETWPTYASHIAGSTSGPEDYNEAAVERLIKDLEPYIVRVKGVRPQFDAINKVEMIKFQTKEEADFYHSAWERYLKEKAELDAKKLLAEGGQSDGEATGIQMLVAFLKFRMAAEICRARYLAQRMYETVNNDGKAAVCALNFKGTIIKAVQILVDEYHVPRSGISLIWGGGQTQLTAKQKAKQKIKAQADKLVAAGMTMDEIMETLDLDDVEDRELQDLPAHLKLGTQSKEDRQREIDRFQSGKSQYCFFTFRAGGVGLSLHHTDEMSPVKVRHQKNGYALIDDIDKVPIRPRRLFAAPTYSAIEIVQGLGRCPRLTSLSDTEQFLVFYTGTIEDDVADIVSKKLRCLSKVVKTREKWSDIVVEGRGKKSAHMQDIPDDDGNVNGTLEGESEQGDE